jgi:hypothetical protein
VIPEGLRCKPWPVLGAIFRCRLASDIGFHAANHLVWGFLPLDGALAGVAVPVARQLPMPRGVTSVRGVVRDRKTLPLLAAVVQTQEITAWMGLQL